MGARSYGRSPKGWPTPRASWLMPTRSHLLVGRTLSANRCSSSIAGISALISVSLLARFCHSWSLVELHDALQTRRTSSSYVHPVMDHQILQDVHLTYLIGATNFPSPA